MTLSTLPFLALFLPISLIVALLLPERFRNGGLFLLSLIFYAWGGIWQLLLLLSAVLVDYFCGRLIGTFQKTPKKAKVVLAFNVIFSVLLLGVFKYSSMAVDTVNHLFDLSVSVPTLILPLGISFFTFRSISYGVDVLRGDSPVQKNLLDFGLYLTFFPQITAGPIVRYRDFAPQLKNHPVTLQKVSHGLTRFGIGLLKKVLIADLLAQISARVQFYEEPSVLAAWIGALAFTFEIYFDFSGYSDMAIGLSEVFGFETPENFLHPYESLSVSEFWRRWHVTLGAWFREYIYIPLGGNRRGTVRTIWNLFVVWLLTGFWHGASWNFVLWGLYYGILIMLEKFPLKNFWGRLPKGICWGYAFLAEVLGWVLFSHTDLVRAVGALGAMFGSASGIDSLGLYLLSTAWPLLLISAVFCTEFPHRLFLKMCRSVPGKILWSAGFAVLFLLSLSAMAGNGFMPFLYAKF